MEDKKQVKVSFLALDPYVEQNIPRPTERPVHGKDRVEWGDRNLYPEFLLDLYNTVPTLRSIVNGTRDFITGDSQSFQLGSLPPGMVDSRRGNIRDLVDAVALDELIFGGGAIQVVRSISGEIVELYHCPMRYLRMNKDCSVFYYSEDWAKAGARKMTVYPAFMPITPERWAAMQPDERERHISSIMLMKDGWMSTYPSPVYAAAIVACDTERLVSQFHLNSVNNGFTSSMIVNFNNGTPSDEMKDEIERNFNEKFAGAQNAGRIMFSWNPDRTNATTITEPKVDDFGNRYSALSKHIRQQIFTAFRANPNLFGIPTDSLGFSQEEYESAFRLYNRTMVRPIQRRICDTFDYITGVPGSLTITPFSLDGVTENIVN